MYCMSICACSDKGNDCRNRVKVTPKAFWSKLMIAKKQCQIQNNPHDSSCDSRQWCGKFNDTMGAFYEWTTRKNKKSEGRKVNQVTNIAATVPAKNSMLGPKKPLSYPPMNPTNVTTIISGPGVVSPRARSSII